MLKPQLYKYRRSGGKIPLRLNSSRAICPTKWPLFGEKAIHLSYQIMAAIGMKCLFPLMHFKIFFPFSRNKCSFKPSLLYFEQLIFFVKQNFLLPPKFISQNFKCCPTRQLLSQFPAFDGPGHKDTRDAAFTATPSRRNEAAKQSLCLNGPRQSTPLLGLCQRRTPSSQTSLAYLSSLHRHNFTNVYYILAGGKPWFVTEIA